VPRHRDSERAALGEALEGIVHPLPGGGDLTAPRRIVPRAADADRHARPVPRRQSFSMLRNARPSMTAAITAAVGSERFVLVSRWGEAPA